MALVLVEYKYVCKICTVYCVVVHTVVGEAVACVLTHGPKNEIVYCFFGDGVREFGTHSFGRDPEFSSATRSPSGPSARREAAVNLHQLVLSSQHSSVRTVQQNYQPAAPFLVVRRHSNLEKEETDNKKYKK